MRILLVGYFFTLSSLAFGQHEIVWNEDASLRWNNFNGVPNDTVLAAVTYCSIDTQIRIKGEDISIDVRAIFYTDSSWYNKSKIHELTLVHEQGHFDIAELYARKLRKLIAEKIVSGKDYRNSFQNLYDENYEAYYDEQLQYDSETLHGTIQKTQYLWIARIVDALTQLNDYKK